MLTTLSFVNQYGNSRAVPSMLLDTSKGGLSPNGTFWLFSVITILGGIWAWIFVPETAGLSLEQMDYLFRMRWYQIGTKGRKEAEIQVDADNERWAQEKTGGHGGAAEQLEYQQKNERRV